jgi:hypothetical protein
MASDVITRLGVPFAADKESKDSLYFWWEDLKATDPTQVQAVWNAARSNQDVTQNEYRAHVLNLPPDEDKAPQVISNSAATAVTAIAEKVKSGAIAPDQ